MVTQRSEPELNKWDAHIKPRDIYEITQEVDEQSGRMLWYLWGHSIMVFERSAIDYHTGEHILYSWWLNEEATNGSH